jgi:hypothetical protein
LSLPAEPEPTGELAALVRIRLRNLVFRATFLQPMGKKMKTNLLLLTVILIFAGCASPDGNSYRPEPPFLFNALADASDSVAENTTGFIQWNAKAHATFFRMLTPQFWFRRDKPEPVQEADTSKLAPYASDSRFLEF